MDLTEKGSQNAFKANSDKYTLDEALEMTGYGQYSYRVILTAGCNLNAFLWTILIWSVIIPATDCDLQLTTAQKGVLSSMLLTGMVFTSHLFGYLADQHGRKYVALRCNLASSVLSLISAFAPNYTLLALLAFLNGAVSSGVMVPSYVYVGENVESSRRPMSVLLCGALANFSTVLLPLTAFFLIPLEFQWNVFGYYNFTSWRLMLLLSSFPAFGGAMLYLLMKESPKFLLTRGHPQEALEVLQCIFTSNTGRPASEFPIQKACSLVPDEMETSSKDESQLKKMWTQTVSLFRKPLLKCTVMACVMQVGLVGASNIFSLWLPQLVTDLMNYKASHPDYGVTFCDVIENRGAIFDVNGSAIALEELFYSTTDLTCTVNLPKQTYGVSIGMGLVQFFVFITSGTLTRWISSYKLLVTLIVASALLCLGMTLATNMWLTVVLMVSATVLLAASVTICIGVLIEFYPTRIRSTATCICMFCARTASSGGTQIMGLLQDNHCNESYRILSVILIGTATLTYFLPRKPTEEEVNK